MSAPNPDHVLNRGARFCIALLLLHLFSIAASGATHALPVPTRVFDNYTYVLVDDLASALQARVETIPLKDKVLLRRSSDPNLIFTLFSSVYLIGEVPFRTPVPTRIEQQRLYIHSDVLSVLGLDSDFPAEQVVEKTTDPLPETLIPEVHYQPSGAELKKRWALDTVVIDAGHGGRDPGAVGPGRTYEKTITLAIAKRLGDRLQKLGIDVVYTRSSDTFISLGNRARIARKAEGDLFISLHCNAGRRKAAGGIEVYFLSVAKTAAAAEVAERENAVLELEADSLEDEEADNTLRGIARSILSDQYLKESQDLAASVRASMAQRFKTLDDRGVKQANFYVMRGTMGAMPSILVEMGFISNPKEEKRLRTERFQKDMANAIFEGIRSFKDTHEKQLSDRK